MGSAGSSQQLARAHPTEGTERRRYSTASQAWGRGRRAAFERAGHKLRQVLGMREHKLWPLACELARLKRPKQCKARLDGVALCHERGATTSRHVGAGREGEWWWQREEVGEEREEVGGRELGPGGRRFERDE
eukprot:scaffold118490_cov31-Tisochrysis_lutea.AAC.6